MILDYLIFTAEEFDGDFINYKCSDIKIKHGEIILENNRGEEKIISFDQIKSFQITSKEKKHE